MLRCRLQKTTNTTIIFLLAKAPSADDFMILTTTKLTTNSMTLQGSGKESITL